MNIGIFGGSFNPVHHGHLRLALEALEILGLDRVELVPSAVPPHKSRAGLLPFGLRYRMIRKAIQDMPDLRCSLIETGRPGPSYTGDTLDALGRTMPGARLFFLLGVPDLLTLPSWKYGLRLLHKAHFVAVARQDMALETTERFVRSHWPEAGEPLLHARFAGQSREEPQQWSQQGAFGGRQVCEWILGHGAGSILLIRPPSLDISATMVREYWLQGRQLRFLLPDGVLGELLRKQHVVARFWNWQDG